MKKYIIITVFFCLFGCKISLDVNNESDKTGKDNQNSVLIAQQQAVSAQYHAAAEAAKTDRAILWIAGCILLIAVCTLCIFGLLVYKTNNERLNYYTQQIYLMNQNKRLKETEQWTELKLLKE